MLRKAYLLLFNLSFAYNCYPQSCNYNNVPTQVCVYHLINGYNGGCLNNACNGNSCNGPNCILINFDDYIAGVVQGEIGFFSGALEAKKAQAIAARTFSQNRYNQGKPVNCGQAFDSSVSTICSTAAASTSGQIILYNGNVIDAKYASRCNGDYTQSYGMGTFHTNGPLDCNFSSGTIPYLQSRQCSGHVNCNISGENPCCNVQISTTGNPGYIYGHGVGLCQYGARDFANAPNNYTYDQILNAFYTGICITHFNSNCLDNYEPNNLYQTSHLAFQIPLFNTPQIATIHSYISTGSDQDWYAVGIDGPGVLSVNLNSLPANYDMELYGLQGNSQPALAGSYRGGDTNEVIIKNQPLSLSTIWYIKVYPNNSSQFNACDDYVLTVSWQPGVSNQFTIPPGNYKKIEMYGVNINQSTNDLEFMFHAFPAQPGDAVINLNAESETQKKIFKQALVTPFYEQHISIQPTSWSTYYTGGPTVVEGVAAQPFRNSEMANRMFWADLYLKEFWSASFRVNVDNYWKNLVMQSPYWSSLHALGFNNYAFFPCRAAIIPGTVTYNTSTNSIQINQALLNVESSNFHTPYIYTWYMDLNLLNQNETNDLNNRLNTFDNWITGQLTSREPAVRNLLNNHSAFSQIRQIYTTIALAKQYKAWNHPNKPFSYLFDSHDMTGITDIPVTNQTINSFWHSCFTLSNVFTTTVSSTDFNGANRNTTYGGCVMSNINPIDSGSYSSTQILRDSIVFQDKSYVSQDSTVYFYGGTLDYPIADLIGIILPQTTNRILSDTIQIDATIYNFGNKNAQQFPVRLYEQYTNSQSQLQNILLSQQIINNIDSFSSQNVSFTWTPLTYGNKKLILTIDEGNQVVEKKETNNIAIDSLLIENNIPLVTVVSPANGSAIANQNVTFSGFAYDPHDGYLSNNNLSWASNIDGVLGNGSYLTIASITTGNHTITFTGTNSHGQTASAYINLYVFPQGYPVVIINSPLTGDTLPNNTGIFFSGNALDLNDGSLCGSASWGSNIDSMLGIGCNINRQLSLGNQTISLTAQNTSGHSATASRQITVLNGVPQVAITAPSANSTFYQHQLVTCQATATDYPQGNISGVVHWYSNLQGYLGTGQSISVMMQPGSHIITASVQDNAGSTDTATISINIIFTPPVPVISQPLSNQTFNYHDTINLIGHATDLQDGALHGTNLKWYSTINGFLGFGDTLQISSLTYGYHIISLKAIDSNGADSTVVSNNIFIDAGIPVCTITQPANGANFFFGNSITLSGTATDPQDGIISGSNLQWHSDADGFLGTGSSIVTNSLIAGNQTITLSTTDQDGFTGSAAVNFYIEPPHQPVVSIYFPFNNNHFAHGDTVALKANATDYEEGVLPNHRISWSSNIDGSLGTGGQLPINTLSVGNHTISVIALDTLGASTSAQISITINDGKPVASILSPMPNSIFAQGDTVNLLGQGIDYEDGILGQSNLSWYSSNNSLLGSGSYLSLTALSTGIHEIKLVATDSFGNTDTTNLFFIYQPYMYFLSDTFSNGLSSQTFIYPLGGGNSIAYISLPSVSSVTQATAKITGLPLSTIYTDTIQGISYVTSNIISSFSNPALNTPRGNYRFVRATTADSVMSSTPYDCITEKNVFRRGETVYHWLYFDNLATNFLGWRWENYDSDNFFNWWLEDSISNASTFAWYKAWTWGSEIDKGRFYTKYFSKDIVGGNFTYETTNYYTVSYFVKDTVYNSTFPDAASITLCKDVSSYLPTSPGVTTFSGISDTTAFCWVSLNDIAESLQLKWEWLKPDNTLYSQVTTTTPDPGNNAWYGSLKAWSWINIANNVPASIPGIWKVNFYIKNNTSGLWELITLKTFTISQPSYQQVYPLGPKIDVADNGIYEWVYSGVYQYNQTTPDFATELNNYISVNSTGQGPILIPVKLYSSSAGQLKLDSLSINYYIIDTIRPILSAVVTPFNVLQNGNFNVNATVTDNDIISSVECTYQNNTFSLNNTSGNNFSVMVNAGTSVGLFPIRVIAMDRSGLTSDTILYVNVYSSTPDLEIQNNGIIISPSELFISDTVHLSAIVKNNSNQTIANADVALVIDGVPFQTQTVTLGALSQAQLNFNWLAQLGQDTIGVKADPLDVIAESDENNNTGIRYIVVHDSYPPSILQASATPNPAHVSNPVFFQVNTIDSTGISSVIVNWQSQNVLLTYNSFTTFYEGYINANTVGTSNAVITAYDVNSLSSSTTISIQVLQNLPDLKVFNSDFLFVPSSSGSGSNVLIQAKVRNSGSIDLNNVNVILRVDGFNIGNQSANILHDSSLVFSFPWQVVCGSHLFNVVIDSANSILETNEANNSVSVNHQFCVPVPTYLLNAQAIPAVVSLGSPTNVQLVSAPATTNASVTVLWNNLNTLMPFSSLDSAYSVQIYPTQTGNYSLPVLFTDSNGFQSAAFVQFTVVDSLPDLAVNTISTNYSVLPNSNAAFSLVVSNYSISSVSNVVVYLLSDSQIVDSIVINSMDAFDTIPLVLHWQSLVGTHQLMAVIDPQNQIAESNDLNNSNSIQVTVQDNEPPVIHFIHTSSPNYEGGIVNVESYITDNDSIISVVANYQSSNYTMQFDSSSATWRVALNTPTNGTYTIGITATDNSLLTAYASTAIEVHDTLPDLEVLAQNIIYTHVDSITNTVSAIVQNNGAGSANGVKIHFVINSYVIDSLILNFSAGQIDTVIFTFNYPVGYHIVTISVDPFGQITESNDTNNSASRNIFIPDLIPPSSPVVTVNPSSWSASPNFIVSWNQVFDNSGSVTYEYSVNGNPWINVGTNLSVNLTVNIEGISYVYVRAKDSFGNLSQPGVGEMKYDNTPPNAPLIAEYHCGTLWTTHDSPYLAWLNPGDVGSGIDFFEVEINNQAPINIGFNFSHHPTLTTGTHHIKVRDIDFVGNIGSWSNEITVYIDLDNPPCPLLISPTHPNQNQWNQNDSIALNWVDPVDTSTVVGYYFMLNHDSAYQVNQTGFSVNSDTLIITTIPAMDTSNTRLSDGIWYIHIVSQDSVGHLSDVTCSYKVMIDKTPPLTISNNVDTTNSCNYTFSLSAYDYYSGVSETRYRINNGNWISDTTVTVTNAGLNVIEFYSLDSAGNVEMIDTTIVFVQNGLSLNLGNDTTVCGSIQLTSPIANTYHWSDSSTSQTIQIDSSAVVILEITDSLGCHVADSISILINAPPNAIAGSNSAICVGTTLNLTASGGTFYSWIGPNSYTSSVQNPAIPTVTLADTGIYSVTVIDSNGCSAAVITIVTINPNPVVTAGNNNIICEGVVLNLISNGATSYSWTGPNSYTSSLQNPIITNITLADSGTYTVTGTDNNGCIAIAQVTVTVNPTPVTTVSPNVTYCSGQSTLLTAAGANTYTWSPATALSAPSGVSVTANPTTTTTYTVIGNALGCTATAQVTVSVNLSPILLPLIHINDTIIISPVTSSDTIQWYYQSSPTPGTDDTLLCVGDGYYYGIVTNSFGCSTISDSININPCTVGINELNGLNTISIYPNPTEGIFTVEIKSNNKDKRSLKIFDVIGSIVSEQKDLKNETKHEVDLREKAPGIYYIEINIGKKSVTKKIVKM